MDTIDLNEDNSKVLDVLVDQENVTYQSNVIVTREDVNYLSEDQSASRFEKKDGGIWIVRTRDINMSFLKKFAMQKIFCNNNDDSLKSDGKSIGTRRRSKRKVDKDV